MRYRIKAAIVAVGVAAAIFVLPAASASAGQYHVYQCHSSYGYANDGWTWGGDAWPYGVTGCTNAFRLWASGLPAGRNEWWQTPALPGGLKFTNVYFISASSTGGGQTSLSAGFCTAGATWYGACPISDGMGISDGTTPYSIPCRWWYYECNVAQFEFNTSDGTKKTANGNFFFYNLDFTVNDPTPPYAWQPHNGTFRDDNTTNPWTDGNYWNSGTRTVGVYGHDTGQSGVKQTRLFFDGDPGNGQVAQVFDKSCNYATWQPCPGFVGDTATINTLAFADGPHTATTRVVDAGDNVTDATTNFKVDNTLPSTPTNFTTPGAMSGWSAVNSFTLNWTNPTENAETATQSGVGAVKIDVDPVSAGTNPSPVTIPVGTSVGGVAATRTSLTGLTVPAVGAYTLKLSVIDKAGNESPLGNGSNGAADGFFSIGYDPNPPAKPQGQNNGWISRAELAGGFLQQWSVTQNSNSAPICGYAKSITPAPADPGTTMNLSGAVNSFVLPTNLTEGPHSVNLRSVNCSGLASLAKESIDAPVDLTDPEGAVSGVEDDHWYKNNQNVHLSGTDALSGMTLKPVNDPVIPDGAYLSYTLNNGPEQQIAGGSADFAVSGEGAKELSFAPVDFAGNKAPAKIVRFGIDASDPTGGFNAPDPNRPTLLSAPIKDPVSGVALATIEVRSQAGGDWITLPTAIADTAGNAVAGYPKDAAVSARFPDTTLPIGTYSVRLTGVDRAGNTLVTSKRTDGSEMTVTNPMRDAVALSAGLSKAKRTCSKKKGVMCVKNARGKVVFSNTYPSLSVGFKRGAVVQGFLTTDKLGALDRQAIEIYAKTKTRGEVLLGTTSTRTDGSYVFKIKPGVSRTIRVYYPGTETRQDASATVQLGTAAKLTMRVSTKHAKTGRTVTFTGNVRSFDGSIPAAGKIVALQFYANKKWRPAVAIVHTDSKGNFSVKYKFDGPRVKARIVFRVYAPTEDGWDHVASASRRITLRLD